MMGAWRFDVLRKPTGMIAFVPSRATILPSVLCFFAATNADSSGLRFSPDSPISFPLPENDAHSAPGHEEFSQAIFIINPPNVVGSCP